MPLLTISCAELGSPCEEDIISGDTIDELMEAIYKHGAEVHGETLEVMKSPEYQAKLLANIKQTARPRGARTTTKLDI
jgi:predicted small metal-binding protein